MNRVYLDYAATTPVDPRVERAMRPYFLTKFGNPGSLHSFGQEAMAAVDESREKIAKAVGAEFREIIFTGSATEANNLVLRGSIAELRRRYAELRGNNFSVSPRSVRVRPRIIVSAVEHESILETARDLEKEGVEVIYLPVDRRGFVDLKKLESVLNERTILVSIIYANNEIGTIQPIAKISQILQEFRKQKTGNRNDQNPRFYFLDSRFPLFHTDAVQAFQFLDCDVQKLGVDLMTLSAHKIYGPKGIGLLYKTQNAKRKAQILGSDFIAPIITGGGQEFNLRSGTENTALIVGFAKAIELVSNSRELENKKIARLKKYFWQQLKKNYPGAEINGTAIDEPRTMNYEPLNTLPSILNIYFPKHPAMDLLVKLDLAGAAISTGSACRARSAEPSYVIRALGFSEERAKNSLRFSFGRPTTKQEIDSFLKIFAKAV